MFNRLVWHADRVLLDDLVFRFDFNNTTQWDPNGQFFRFRKSKKLVDQYAKFWMPRQDFRADNILEIGIWQGGSVAFWFECFHPMKHVALDRAKERKSDYLSNYIKSRGLEDNIKLFWETDQSNSERLRAIVQQEFRGLLDMVIDDASHLYAPTKASFETLFPLLRPGGLYVIEDWSWGHWPTFNIPPQWLDDKTPTQLVFELMELTGTRPSPIESVNIFESFVVIERGEMVLADSSTFKVEDHVCRRMLPSKTPAASPSN
jgi:hypothetical protein